MLPGAVVAIVSSEPRRLREILASADGVSGLVLMGDGLHLVVDDSRRRIPELRARLIAEGLPFDSMEAITPAIEDLFVAAVQAGGSGATA
jgi:ABC-2 type transport system ATP-binding protein